ncbi:MAG: oxidoreductase domain protein [Gemmatimonadetes bacterium]|nr:oxidoreductase domain protein [Gemmatimonadota bacterium]
MTDRESVRWGILGTANIALKKVVPAMLRSRLSRVVAIASRDEARAQSAASSLGIPRAYGSYEALLADPSVDAIYNPLPNHLHVPWSIRAAQAGKHVLCEKPIALSANEARELLVVRDRTGVQIGEAFMVRTHPQWHEVRRLIANRRVGDLRLVSGHFSYYRRDPSDIRSQVEFGGGALMDIGCYPIMLSRWIFGAEPIEVIADLERDPEFGVDRLTSVMMRFPSGQATFTAAGQLAPYQKMHMFGTAGRIEVDRPFNPSPDFPAHVIVDDGRVETIDIPPVDQFMLQADRFSEAILGTGTVPATLEDAIANMEVIDALVRSAESRRWGAVPSAAPRAAAPR